MVGLLMQHVHLLTIVYSDEWVDNRAFATFAIRIVRCIHVALYAHDPYGLRCFIELLEALANSLPKLTKL